MVSSAFKCLLKRPEIRYLVVTTFLDQKVHWSAKLVQVEIQIKYEGYIQRLSKSRKVKAWKKNIFLKILTEHLKIWRLKRVTD